MRQTAEALRERGVSIVQSLTVAGDRLAREFPALGRAGRFVLDVLRKYHQDDCLTYAASVSFFLTISLIPLTTLFFKLMVLMLGTGAYSLSLQRAISTMYPYLPKGFIFDSIQNSRRVVGLGSSWVVLLVGAHWGVNQLDRSLSHIFGLRIKVHRQTRKYPLLRRFLVVVGILVGLVVLLAAMFNWALLSRAPLASMRVLHLLPPVFGLALVTLVLQHLPRRHVLFRHAFLGGLVCSALWGVARLAFGYYLKHTPTWGILYGSLGSVMAALVFLYYSCAIFMLGAEVTAAFYRPTGTGAFPTLKNK
jgi:membrane protein